MKPFSIWLHRIKTDLLEIEYPHLAIHNGEKKKLALYPGIIVKCKDIKQEKSKTKFQICLGPSLKVKCQQLKEMNIKRALIIDGECDTSNEFNEYETENLKE